MTKFKIQIDNVTIVDELPNYWTNQDYFNLLEIFNFSDIKSIKKENVQEYLKMAITDFEPDEAADLLLTYKLSEQLTEGQIQQISNDMLLDKICEEYPEISLHAPLFSINQLLFKAYNGKFPNASATIIMCKVYSDDENIDLTDKGLFLRILVKGLADSNIIKRLFTEQLKENKEFPEANDILWELEALGNNKFKVITSEYWISKSDVEGVIFEANIEIPD